MDRSLLRALAALLLVASVAVGCTGASEDDPAATPEERSQQIEALTGALPAGARSVFVADLGSLLSGDDADAVAALLEGDGVDPAWGRWFATIGTLGESVDLDRVTAAAVVHTTDAAQGPLLLATIGDASLDEVADVEPVDGDPEAFADDAGNRLALLDGGVLAVGSEAAVAAAADGAGGSAVASPSPIAPYLAALDASVPVTFAMGLPALLDDAVEADRTLRGAQAVTGALDVAEGAISGSMAFHTENAEQFVEAYNGLDRNATQGDEATVEPLEVGAPVVEAVPQVIVPLPPVALDATAEEVRTSRNLAKKLFVGMAAHDYAERVADLEVEPLVDLIVKSEADGDEPPSPGSVFIRWRFRDQAAIDAFEADVLPEGFSLAPTRFVESDSPDGEYFLALNLYNSGGGSIVNGMRAEWDVFVDAPVGADPDAGKRPRFMIVDALAEAVSADPVNLVTPAEPLSHRFEGDRVVSTVARDEDGREVPVFEASFPTPDPSEAEVARFTREMAIGNDYIYWANGVYDRAVYDATTFNHDAYVVDPADVEIRDDSRWAQYLEPEPLDVVYYVNTLEYVASPLANLDSEFLDVTPEWREELKTFKTNGHQAGLVRGAVEQLFRGEADALVGERISNEVPSTTYTFEITDPDAFEATLDLPDGHRLMPIAVVDGGPEQHLLTLMVSEADDAVEGTRAEWSVTVDDGSGRPHRLVLDRATEEVGVDPLHVLSPPSLVRHELVDGELRTELASPTVSFAASFPTAGATDEVLSLDWVESGDTTCSRIQICDKRFYDAETLDVPVHRPAEVEIATLTTPWDDLIDPTPTTVHYRDNAQQFAVSRWYDLQVPVERLPIGGIEDRTHTLTGTGSLVGRTTDIVDSQYTYTGDAVVEDGELSYVIDQQIDNALGVANIYLSGTFDLETGTGTQTVEDCRGPDLMCGDIVRGSTEPYQAQDLDASDPDEITWKVALAIELGGTFGTADSDASYVARAVD